MVKLAWIICQTLPKERGEIWYKQKRRHCDQREEIVVTTSKRTPGQPDASPVSLRRLCTQYRMLWQAQKSHCIQNAQSKTIQYNTILFPLYGAHAHFSWNSLALHVSVVLRHAPSICYFRARAGFLLLQQEARCAGCRADPLAMSN